MWSKSWIVVIFFLILVCILRISTFFQSVIDWDESVYLLMSKSMLDGNLPYTQVWDHKPPGIYLLFSLSQIVFGQSVISIRILTCIFVSISCLFLYKSGNVINPNNNQNGLLAGILYAFFSLKNGGLSANTELFFAFFNILSFYLVFITLFVSNKELIFYKFRFFIIGLIMGISLHIKYLVIFDFLAILLTIISFYYLKSNHRRWIELAKIVICLLTGAFIPFLLFMLYFLKSGYLNEYIYANFIANKIYSAETQFSIRYFSEVIFGQSVQNHPLWLCLFLTPFYLYFLIPRKSETSYKFYVLLIWFFMAFIGTCATKKFYPHYFLQVLPPLCLISSYMVINLLDTANLKPIRLRFALILIFLFPLLLSSSKPLKASMQFINKKYVQISDDWKDTPTLVSNYIKSRITEDDYIYMADYQPIVYFLTNSKIPTKYVLPNWFIKKEFSRFIGINLTHELSNILKKDPVYIVIKNSDKLNGNNEFYIRIRNHVREKYVLENTINNVLLYRFKNPNEYISQINNNSYEF
jgi:4-amino-4-deoxy-L-arabinose transferase-like glycosyltransferase